MRSNAAQGVAARQERGCRRVAPDLQADVGDHEQRAVRAERLGQRGGEQQARAHHAEQRDAHGGRVGVEPVDHPGRVDPRPPDHEQQERGASGSREVEVLDQDVRDLCDGEHVDQVEEELDERDRLLAVLARSQVARTVECVVGRHAGNLRRPPRGGDLL